MKKVKNLMFAAGATLLLSSCASVKSPLTGVLYSDVKAPLTATSNSNSSKVGSAEATSILGAVATGDASIDAAAKSAGITKIHHVDEQSTSFLGIFAKYKVFVYGE
ncbi:TRL-like protein family protein [Mesonia phycicola]|uniref:TRL-like protein family protein n=1 Tax=Mesonia phycicola TaxID=579105 RepID=A0A1M6ASB2_9FLAO|nr:TRL-like family protein [Mesonia phycicola]SHI39301.1 TRL-like protein family protein [Mesonia phycicola]